MPVNVYTLRGFSQQHSLVLLRRCLTYFRPYLWRIILATLVMILAGMCDAGAAWLVKPALDDIFIQKNAHTLYLIPLAFFCLTLVKATGRLLQNYMMQYCGLRVLEKLREELYGKIIFLPMRFYEDAQVGMLMSRIISDVVAIRGSMPALVMIARQIITLISLLAVVFYQDAWLAFWAVVVLPLAFGPFWYFSRRIRMLSRKNQVKLGEISTLLQEVLSGIRVVKTCGMEEAETRRFDKENKRLLRIALKQSMAGEFSSSAMELVGALGIGLVILFGGLQVIHGESTPGTFFSFVAALIMMYEPIKKMTASNNDIQKALAGAERVFEILDDPGLSVEKSGTLPFAGPFRDLAFENVSFSYADGTEALIDCSFSIRAGQRIAIVGPSGAGKTTFVSLIPRFYDPLQGRILLNGLPLAEYSLSSLRKAIALVSQDHFLFNLSVQDNILYGTGEALEEDARRAAKAAFADSFILSLPEGYATLVGERGVKLSGGQRQRLTIARALVKNAPLLILDEATSALDSQSEQVVQQALDNLMRDRTTIIIAHRLSTVINADHILVMDKGRIVGQGKHAELLRESPLYARLYATQFQTPKDGSLFPTEEQSVPGILGEECRVDADGKKNIWSQP
ncbi:MAG: ATP-binding cassette domain-containing protein [Desulfovibrio sp.]|jgi:subfamily B ATP-binding cassette protein MsbA|nr:ATP-binding cassette domain-containing protein [Desulfovibrio sp.]